MTRPSTPRRRNVEYFLLVEPRAAGAVIGRYRDCPIAESVIDAFGRRYAYVGLAPRRRDGGYDAEALKQGEWVAEPGLVYVEKAAPIGSAKRRRGLW